ncbi:FHA domain-containing protein, partial [Kibdelosporangium lantanae]
LRTQVPRTWPLSDDERLILVALGQRYLLQQDHPQPLAYQHVADLLNELAPDREWNERKVEARVSTVRSRLIASGVPNLTRKEVGEPVGNLLNHNLLTELVVTSGTLTRGDLVLIED